MPVAAVTVTAAVGWAVLPRMTPDMIVIGLGLALLLPIAPFVLELLALRRLNTAAFGTLMSLEPALALLIGFVVVHQVPNSWAIFGVGFVVAAGDRRGPRRNARYTDARSARVAQPPHSWFIARESVTSSVEVSRSFGRVIAISSIAAAAVIAPRAKITVKLLSGVWPWSDRPSSTATIAAAIELPTVRAMAFMLVATPPVSPASTSRTTKAGNAP